MAKFRPKVDWVRLVRRLAAGGREMGSFRKMRVSVQIHQLPFDSAPGSARAALFRLYSSISFRD